MLERSDILKSMTMRLQAFGGSTAAALAVPLRSGSRR